MLKYAQVPWISESSVDVSCLDLNTRMGCADGEAATHVHGMLFVFLSATFCLYGLLLTVGKPIGTGRSGERKSNPLLSSGTVAGAFNQVFTLAPCGRYCVYQYRTDSSLALEEAIAQGL